MHALRLTVFPLAVPQCGNKRVPRLAACTDVMGGVPCLYERSSVICGEDQLAKQSARPALLCEQLLVNSSVAWSMRNSLALHKQPAKPGCKRSCCSQQHMYDWETQPRLGGGDVFLLQSNFIKFPVFKKSK